MPTPDRQAGFTLVEVMVAATILLVGVLGTLALLDGANVRTSETRAREGATNLARELVEAARELPYRQAGRERIVGRLQARPALTGNGSADSWEIERRGVEYAVAVDVCTVDEATDGLGDHSGPEFCPDLGSSGSSDENPADLKRVAFEVSWPHGAGRRQVRQVTVVTPRSADLPSVTELRLTSPLSSEVTSSSVTSMSFAVTVSPAADSVGWTVDGADRGLASGASLDWSFTWPLDEVLDGPYDVGAVAYDRFGGSGATRSMTVTLNRFPPAAPKNFRAGRNGPGVVEAEWTANAEGDVVGYRVYRREGSKPEELACSIDDRTVTSCIDANAPGGKGRLYYYVRAVDRDPNGAERVGDSSAEVDVNATNRPPKEVRDLSAVMGADGTVTLTWTVPSPGDPDAGDSIDSFRIYRGGTTFDHRVDRVSPGSATSWTDETAGGQRFEYYVTSVDTHLRESPFAGPVSP